MIYAVNVGAHKKPAERENCVNRGYLLVLKDKIINRVKSKIAEIETVESEECL